MQHKVEQGKDNSKVAPVTYRAVDLSHRPAKIDSRPRAKKETAAPPLISPISLDLASPPADTIV